MAKEIWTTWEAKYEDGHTVFAKDISYCGLSQLERDLFELMQKHKLYKLNVSNPEQIEITFDPAHEVNLTWEK
jgi:hypothetical protein